MAVRIMDNTLGGSGYDVPGAESSSGAADPELMQRLLRYIQPTPVPAALQGGGPSPPIAPGGPGSAGNDGGFNNPYMAAAGANPPQGGPYVGSGAPPTPAAPGNPTPWFPSSNTPLPWQGPNAPMPPARPVTPTPVTAYPPAIDPRMTGVVPPAAAVPPSSPFTTIDAPNANPGIGGGMMGGALARGGSGGRGQITALDLSHLFGGGQPAAAAPLPKTKINVGKIPPNATASVSPEGKSPSMTEVKSGPIDPSIKARQKERWAKIGDY